MDLMAQAIQEALKREMQNRGRLGGRARATSMTAEERRRSALKASKAAAKARRKKARQKSDALGANHRD
jgi:hypothetical protein